MPNVNESQLPVQIIGTNTPDTKESQLPIQVIGINVPRVRMSQLPVQVLVSSPRQQPKVWITRGLRSAGSGRVSQPPPPPPHPPLQPPSPSPSAIITANNIDDIAPGGWPPTGWKPVCILPACNPGGVGIPTATSQTNGASPNLDGAAMQFSVTGPAYTNALWTYIAGVSDRATYFNADYWYYITAANFAKAQALEIDMFNFSTTDNIYYMMGTQYNCITGLWQVYDSAGINYGGWVNTTVTVPPTVNGWTHIQQQAHRIPGDLTHVYYDWIIINGVTYWYSGSLGVPQAQATNVLPSGWASAVGIQFQLDINSSGGSLAVNIDEAGFIVSSVNN